MNDVYLALARFDEKQVDRFKYLESFRHAPNLPGRIVVFGETHWVGFFILLAVLFFGPILLPPHDGIGWKVGLLLVAFLLVFAYNCYRFADFPTWHPMEPADLADLGDTMELRLLNNGGALLSVYKQVFKWKEDPNAKELARIWWLVLTEPSGTETWRAVTLWSSIEERTIWQELEVPSTT